MARIDEWFHGLLNQRILVLFHSLVKHFVVAVALGYAAAEDARLLHTHQHFVVLEVQDLALQLKLLRKVRNNQSGHDLASLVAHLFLL